MYVMFDRCLFMTGITEIRKRIDFVRFLLMKPQNISKYMLPTNPETVIKPLITSKIVYNYLFAFSKLSRLHTVNNRFSSIVKQ